MNEWISVRDQLPSKDDSVIVCLINGIPILCEVHDYTLSLTDGRVSFFWPKKEWIKDEYYGEVTHWIPLPLLPALDDAQ